MPPPPDPPLAFIFGFPRSGTTLLAKLLDSHSSVLYLHEPLSKGRGLLIHDVIRHLGHRQSSDAALLDRVTNDLIQRRAEFLQPPFFREDFTRMPGGAGLAWAWQQITGRSAALLTAPQDRGRIRLVVVKDGLSSYALALAQRLHARALVLLRHPCAVVNSMLRGHQVGAMAHVDRQWFWESLHEVLGQLGYDESTVRAMHADEFEALRWLVSNHQVLALQGNPQNRVLTYSQLIRQTTDVVDGIFPWLGLEVQPSTLAFIDHIRHPGRQLLRRILGAKKMYFALSPRSDSPETAWQTELSPEAQRRVLKIVEPFPLGRFWPGVEGGVPDEVGA